jgi:hypothetical protein
MSLSLLHPDAYPEGTRLELTQLVASLQGMLGREHDGEGVQRRIWQRWNLGENLSVPGASAVTVIPMRRPDTRNVGDLTLDAAGGVVTVRTPGIYQVLGQVQWAANATGVRGLIVQRDMSYEGVSQVPAIGGGAVTHMQVLATFPCVAGTTIRLMGYQDSGGALNAVALLGTAQASTLTIARVA